MLSAAFIHRYLLCVYLIFFNKSGKEFLIFSVGKVSPIVPVEPNSISFDLTKNFFSSPMRMSGVGGVMRN